MVGRFPNETSALVMVFSLLEEEQVKWQEVTIRVEDIAWIEEVSKDVGARAKGLASLLLLVSRSKPPCVHQLLSWMCPIFAEDLQIAINYSLQRSAEQAEIAATAVFLASHESSAITGHTLVVNYGHHIVQ